MFLDHMIIKHLFNCNNFDSRHHNNAYKTSLIHKLTLSLTPTQLCQLSTNAKEKGRKKSNCMQQIEGTLLLKWGTNFRKTQ